MMRSLRTRLLAGIIGGMILLLIVFSLLIYFVIRSTLVKQFDISLASVAQILAASVEIDANGIDVEIEVQQMPEFTDPNHPMNYQIWNLDGQVISRSPLLGTDDLPCFHDSLDKPIFKAFPGPEDHGLVENVAVRVLEDLLLPLRAPRPGDTQAGWSRDNLLAAVGLGFL